MLFKAITVVPGSLLREMMAQKDKIWELCEEVDQIRPSLRRGMCEMFPEDPPKDGVVSYTAQTGIQHPLNSQLFRQLDDMGHTYWRTGPAKGKTRIKPAAAAVVDARSKSLSLSLSLSQKIKLTLLKIGLLTPPVAPNDLSDSDQDDETTDEEEEETEEMEEMETEETEETEDMEETEG